MARLLSVLVYDALLSYALGDWVGITGLPGEPHEMGVERTEQEEWVPVTGKTLWPPQGYDPEVIGNLQEAKSVPPNFAARNFALVAPVSAGSPPQPVSLLLDSDGSDIWLPSIRCTGCAADKEEQEHFYHATESSTFEPLLARTPYGLAPRAVGVKEGGGHVGGYVINDTIRIGSLAVPRQPFILAEEGDLVARRERAWDGVFGFGRKPPLSRGPSLHANLQSYGHPATYILAPETGRYLSDKAARLAVGIPEDRLEAIGPFAWTRAVTISSGGGTGSWAFKATAKVQDLEPTEITALIETGTSFMLVPAAQYLRIARTLVPQFDHFCGVDRAAGNIVVCDCEAKKDLTKEVTLEMDSMDGQPFKWDLKMDHILQEAPAKKSEKHWMANNEEVCVLQVQQLPPMATHDSPFGILGHPFADEGSRPFQMTHPGPMPGGVIGPMMLPMGPGPMMRPGIPGLGPFGSMKPPTKEGLQKEMAQQKEMGEVIEGMQEAVQAADRKHEGQAGLVGELLKKLSNLDGTGSVMKEEISQVMGNGERCVTELVRSPNGTVLEEKTWLVTESGQKIPEPKPGYCPKSKQRRLEASAGAGALRGRRLQQGPGELWVLGDIFLRRHAVAFDFEKSRLGFAIEEATSDELLEREEQLRAAQEGASIEAQEPGDGPPVEQFNEDGEDPEQTEAWARAQAAAQALQDRVHQAGPSQVVYNEVQTSGSSAGMKTLLVATALFMGVGAFCGLFSSTRGGLLEETRTPAFTEHFRQPEDASEEAEFGGEEPRMEAAE